MAHRLESAGGAAVEPIRREFGDAVASPDGSIDRRRLSSLVFGNPKALAKLNAIVHPLVAAEVRRWLADYVKTPFRVVVVPLLYEVGFDKEFDFDAVMAVVCSEEVQMARLAGRGHTRDEALARIAAQMPCGTKASLADYAIENNTSLEDLKDKIRSAVADILKHTEV